MQFTIPNPFRWLRSKSPAFTASADSADSFQTHAAPMVPSSGPAKPSGFMASSAPQDNTARIVNSYRFKTSPPAQRAAILKAEAERLSAAPAAIAEVAREIGARPGAVAALMRSGPAKVTTVKPAPRKAADWDKLSREMGTLAALADRAVARVRAEKERAEIGSLTGLDKTAASFRAQLANTGLAAPDGTGGELDAVKRSKPSQNPAFVPEPNRDVRLRQCNDYYKQELAEIEVELDAAKKRGRIPQELLSRKARTEKEWTLASDKILGRDIRK